MKIRPLGAELLHAGGRTDGQTDVMKLIVVCVILPMYLMMMVVMMMTMIIIIIIITIQIKQTICESELDLFGAEHGTT